jgi:hypothetical protein
MSVLIDDEQDEETRVEWGYWDENGAKNRHRHKAVKQREDGGKR